MASSSINLFEGHYYKTNIRVYDLNYTEVSLLTNWEHDPKIYFTGYEGYITLVTNRSFLPSEVKVIVKYLPKPFSARKVVSAHDYINWARHNVLATLYEPPRVIEGNNKITVLQQWKTIRGQSFSEYARDALKPTRTALHEAYGVHPRNYDHLDQTPIANYQKVDWEPVIEDVPLDPNSGMFKVEENTLSAVGIVRGKIVLLRYGFDPLSNQAKTIFRLPAFTSIYLDGVRVQDFNRFNTHIELALPDTTHCHKISIYDPAPVNLNFKVNTREF